MNTQGPIIQAMNTVDINALMLFVIGWAPKAFVSSQSQRSDASMQQKPEDFMDEEVIVLIIFSFTLGRMAHKQTDRQDIHVEVHTSTHNSWQRLCLPLVWYIVIISAKCERSEHWKRLWDWSFCLSFCVFIVVCVCLCTQWLIIAMTSLHQQCKQQCWLLH